MNDTNTNPNLVNFPIPSNDDATKSIKCILSIIEEAVSEGLKERSLDQEKKNDEKKDKANKIVNEEIVKKEEVKQSLSKK